MIRLVEFERGETPPVGYTIVNSTRSFIEAAEAVLGALGGQGTQQIPVLVAVEYESGWANAVRWLLNGVDSGLVTSQALGPRAQLAQLGQTVPPWLDSSLVGAKVGELTRLFNESTERIGIVQALLHCYLGDSLFLQGLEGREAELVVLCAEWEERGSSDLQVLMEHYLESVSGIGRSLASFLRPNFKSHAQGLLACWVVRNYPVDLREEVTRIFGIDLATATELILSLPRLTFSVSRAALPAIAPRLAVVIEQLGSRSTSATEFLKCASGVLMEELLTYIELVLASPVEYDPVEAERMFGQLPEFSREMAAVHSALGRTLRHEKYRHGLPNDLEGWIRLYHDAYVPGLEEGETERLAHYDKAFAEYLVRNYVKLVTSHPLFTPNWVRNQYQEHEKSKDVLILLLLDGVEAHQGERLLWHIMKMTAGGDHPKRYGLLEEKRVGVSAIPTITRVASRAAVYGGPIRALEVTESEEDLFRKHFSNGIFARISGVEAAALVLAKPANEYCLIYRTVDALQHQRRFASEETTEAADAMLQLLFKRLLVELSTLPHLRTRQVRLLVVADHGKIDIDPSDVMPEVKKLMTKYHLTPDHARILTYDLSEHTAEALARALGDDWIVLDPARFFLPGLESGGVGYVIPRGPYRTTPDLPRRVHAGLALPECLVPLFALTTITPKAKDPVVSVLQIPELIAREPCEIRFAVSNPNEAIIQSVEISIPDVGVQVVPVGNIGAWIENGTQEVIITVTPPRPGRFTVDVYVDFVYGGEHKRCVYRGLLNLDVQSGDLGRNLLDDEFGGV